MKTIGKITNRVFKPDDLMLYQRILKRLDGKNVILEIKEDKENRSNQMNRYYWGVVINYFIVGYEDLNSEVLTPSEAHEFLKQQFNYTEILNKQTGEAVRIGRTTTDLNNSDFIAYMDMSIKFIADWFYLEVPPPDQNWRDK
jgi:hypothetical protein